MMSFSKKIQVYVQLLDEGAPTIRLTEGEDLGGGLVRLLATHDYDPDDEKWEFPPGSIVRTRRHRSGKLIAVRPS